MHSSGDSWDAVLSYLTACFAIFWSNMDEIGTLLGFILLLARLIVDVPKAYRSLFGKKKIDDEESSN